MRIGFVDSGIGGLVFALDFSDSVGKKNLEIIHIGDTKNAPYGIKTPNELEKIVDNLLEIAIKKNLKHIVVACNTACTILSQDKIDNYKNNGIFIYEILNKSAEALYKSAIEKDNEIHIAVLGTKQTISSESYQKRLIKLHQSTGKKSELFIHAFSPITWENDIENGIEKKDIKNHVNRILNKFKKEIKEENFKKISSVGLFCTHYPYFKNEIQDYFKTANIVTQGCLFNDIVSNIEISNIENKIISYFTGNELDSAKKATSSIEKNIEFSLI